MSTDSTQTPTTVEPEPVDPESVDTIETIVSSVSKHTLDILRNVHYDIEERLRDMFTEFDADDSGTIDLQEFSKIALRLNTTFPELKISETAVHHLLAEADVTKNGVLDYKEFVPAAARILASIELIQKSRKDFSLQAAKMYLIHGFPKDELSKLLLHSFARADSNHDGTLSPSEFHDALMEAGAGITRKEANLLLHKLGSKHSIDYQKATPIIFDYLLQSIADGISVAYFELTQAIDSVYSVLSELIVGSSDLVDVEKVTKKVTEHSESVWGIPKIKLVKFFATFPASGTISISKISQDLAKILVQLTSSPEEQHVASPSALVDIASMSEDTFLTSLANKLKVDLPDLTDATKTVTRKDLSRAVVSTFSEFGLTVKYQDFEDVFPVTQVPMTTSKAIFSTVLTSVANAPVPTDT